MWVLGKLILLNVSICCLSLASSCWEEGDHIAAPSAPFFLPLESAVHVRMASWVKISLLPIVNLQKTHLNTKQLPVCPGKASYMLFCRQAVTSLDPPLGFVFLFRSWNGDVPFLFLTMPIFISERKHPPKFPPAGGKFWGWVGEPQHDPLKGIGPVSGCLGRGGFALRGLNFHS